MSKLEQLCEQTYLALANAKTLEERLTIAKAFDEAKESLRFVK